MYSGEYDACDVTLECISTTGKKLHFLLGDMHCLMNSILFGKRTNTFRQQCYLRTGYCGVAILT
jgi:hypothetical protein